MRKLPRGSLRIFLLIFLIRYWKSLHNVVVSINIKRSKYSATLNADDVCVGNLRLCVERINRIWCLMCHSLTHTKN